MLVHGAARAVAVLALSACAHAPPPSIVTALAPTGVLRAAINLGNPVLAQPSADGTEPRGVSVEIAREVARRLDVPARMVVFDAAGKVFAAAAAGAWDIAFLAIEPARSAELVFTQAYVEIEGTYLVRADSAYRAVDAMDQANIRIAVGAGSAYDLYLSRTLRSARLVRAETSGAAVERFVSERLDAAAGVRQPLERYAGSHPDLRVIDGRFMAIEQAVAMHPGHPEAAQWLRGVVRELVASGFIADALRRSGQTDARVVPPE